MINVDQEGLCRHVKIFLLHPIVMLRNQAKSVFFIKHKEERFQRIVCVMQGVMNISLDAIESLDRGMRVTKRVRIRIINNKGKNNV